MVEGRELFVRISIGIADNQGDALDADELLCRADIAMYAAKARGRDRYELFEPHMQSELSARHELQGDLRNALEDDQLVLHYQPLTNLEHGTIESFEALVRWNHPTRGLVAPDDFIPIAEETGLIIPIGRWVLREACRQLAHWRATLPVDDDLAIGVNVSSQQLHDPSFVGDVHRALADTGLAARAPRAGAHGEHAADRHHAGAGAPAHAEGDRCALAIDDFGTGYSSLAYLRTFPGRLPQDRSQLRERVVTGD